MSEYEQHEKHGAFDTAGSVVCWRHQSTDASQRDVTERQPRRQQHRQQVRCDVVVSRDTYNVVVGCIVWHQRP